MDELTEDIILNKDKSKDKLDLFIPLGTNFDATMEGSKPIAEKLFLLIKHFDPKRIDLFESLKSKKTTWVQLEKLLDDDNLTRKYKRRCKHHLIEDVDDFEEIYDLITDVIAKQKNTHNIIIDYTSGTKTMTVATCSAAIVNNIPLVIVSGDRGSTPIIQSGTEFVKPLDFKAFVKDQLFNEIKDLFNNHRFNQGIERLDSVIEDIDEKTYLLTDAEEEKLYYRKLAYNILFHFYKHFDDFNHEEALNSFSPGLYVDFSEFEHQLNRNHNSLKILNDPNHEEYEYYLIGSLYNNALRRAEEGRYDDAIVRLHRCTEIISEKDLKDERIDPDNVDLLLVNAHNYTKNSIDDLLSTYYNTNLRRNVKYVQSIRKRFHILYYLHTDVGNEYNKGYVNYNNLLRLRNKSIAAHGDEPRTYDDFYEFAKMVWILFKALTPDSATILHNTKFPKFN